MAEEVGAAFVSLIPSARGFSKLAQRELNAELRGNRTPTIRVTPTVDADTARADITAQLTGVGRQVTVPVDVDVDRSQVTRELVGVTSAVTRREHMTVDADVDAGELLRDTRRAVAVAEAGAGDIDVDVDVDTRRGGFLGRLLGGAIGDGIQSAGGFIQEGVFTPLRGIANNPIISSIGTAIALALVVPLGAGIASALGAAISAAFIGGAGLGVIGLGAFLLRENPEVKEAAGSLMATIKGVFATAALPLVGPIVEALGILRNLVLELSPSIGEMFSVIAPAIVPLTRGIAGLIREAMPGFLALVKSAAPFLQDLEQTLPRFGEHLSRFFGIISEGGPEAALFFRDFLHLLGLGLVVLAKLINGLAQWYATTRRIVLAAIDLWLFFQGGVGRVVNAVVGFFGRLRDFISGVWRRVRGDTDGFIGFMRSLPGRIVRAVGNLGNLLYQAGRNVVQGLIDGIKSKVGDLAGAAAGLAGTIRGYLPFSPAKVGPLSGRGAPFRSGQAIVRDLAAGMDRALPTVVSASSQLAGTVTANARTGAGAQATPRLAWEDGATGDQLLDALRELIRIRYDGVPDNALASA